MPARNGYHRAVPFWAWIPLVVLLVLALLLGLLVLLGRIKNGKYLRPIVVFLSKVPLFKRWFQKASIAALERQNPELAAAMKKMSQFGEPKTPEQAQRMLNLLTPAELGHLLHRRGKVRVLALERRDRRLLEPPLEERHLREERDDRAQVAPVLDAAEQHEDAQQERDDEQHDEGDPGPERHGAMVPGTTRPRSGRLPGSAAPKGADPSGREPFGGFPLAGRL